MPAPVYLDNHSTTRVDPRVVGAMLPFFTEVYGNPASGSHAFGWEARDAVDRARAEVAALVGAEPDRVVFTSGATESNNLALKGVAGRAEAGRNHLIVSAIEHRSVLAPAERLARAGWEVTVIPPDALGRIDVAAVERALTPRTALVSVQAANHEVGALPPVAAIGAICRDRGVAFHCDATQAVGKIALDLGAMGVDLLSLSAHKFHGPKGVGALVLGTRDEATRLVPLLDGGGQEHGRRSGTVAVPLVVGLGHAAALAREGWRDGEPARLAGLRDRLHEALVRRLGEAVRWHGPPVAERLPNNLNVGFAGVDGEALMLGLRDVAVSTGSACGSGGREPSSVLRAMGVDNDLARASLRFGVGRFTTPGEVEVAAEAVARVVDRLRR